MGAKPISLAFNQARPASAPGPMDGFLHGLMNLDHIHSVNGFSRHAVALGTQGDIRDQHGSAHRHLDGIEVVVANENNGELENGRQIQSFMKIPPVGSPIAKVA